MDPADPERPPTAEGGASGAEKGKKRDEIASTSSNEPSGGTQVETDGLKGGGVEHDDGDGGDASPESASPSSRSSTGGSGRNGRSAVSAAALVGGSTSGSETLTEPAGGPHAGPSGTPAPPQASGSAGEQCVEADPSYLMLLEAEPSLRLFQGPPPGGVTR